MKLAAKVSSQLIKSDGGSMIKKRPFLILIVMSCLMANRSVADSDCISFKHFKVEHEGKICFSIRPLLTCHTECEAVETIHSKVLFQCYYPDIKPQSPEMITQAENIALNIEYPISCAPKKASGNIQ